MKRRFDLHLRAVEAAFADLDDLAPHWPELSAFDRADFTLEWSHVIADKYAELRAAALRGLLTGEQMTRFRTAEQRCRALDATLSALGLAKLSLADASA